jgi:hypothetical protein
MNGYNVVFVHSGMLLASKKNELIPFATAMDEPGRRHRE